MPADAACPKRIRQAFEVQCERKEADRKRAEDEASLRDSACVICHDVFVAPVRLCASGHYCCVACVAQYMQTQNVDWGYDNQCMPYVFVLDFRQLAYPCPICRLPFLGTSVAETREPLLNALLPRGRDVLKCPNRGCEDQLAVPAFITHVLVCPCATTECKYCSQKVRTSELNTHVEGACKRLTCHFCGDAPTERVFDYAALGVHMRLVHCWVRRSVPSECPF